MNRQTSLLQRAGTPLLCLTLSATISAPAATPRAQRPARPYTFERNQGQYPAQVQYQAVGSGYELFLTDREAVLTLARGRNARQVVRMALDGAQAPDAIEPESPIRQTTNYLIGNDRSKWKTDVPHYGQVRYSGVYPGIDLVYHSAEERLEYDFVVSPGSNPGGIGIRFQGADAVNVTREGALELRFGGRRLLHQKPVAYQGEGGARREVAAAYEVRANGAVGFRLGEYDRFRELVIDPVVVYSTFLGGDRTEEVNAIAVDAQGNTYVTGVTASGNFPVTGSGITQIQGAVPYAFVTKYNAAGTAIVYSTLLGGGSNTTGLAITVDNAGNAFVGGVTGARNFPLVNPVQATQPGLNIGYVAKLNPQGNALLFSTYIGGERNDEVRSIALDASGNIHVTGKVSSAQFPVVNAMQPTFGGSEDAFVAMYSAPNYRLAYSTYLGKSAAESATALTVDAGGATYITGMAFGEGLATPGAYQARNISPNDVFLAKLNAAGALDWFTYYGGRGDDKGLAIALDPFGNVLVGGSTNSNNLPTTSNALQAALHGDNDAFLAKFSNTGRDLLYATYFGSTATRTTVTEAIQGIGVDGMGGVNVAGTANGADFPSVRQIQQYGGGVSDGFVARFNQSLTGLVYSTPLGGSTNDAVQALAVDAAGGVHVGGTTFSANFPLKNAVRTTFSSTEEAFVTHICDPYVVTSSSKLTFTALPNQPAPAAQTLQIMACTAIPYSIEVQGTFLSATPLGGSTNGTATVSVQPGTLAPGTYRGALKIIAPDAVIPQVTVEVELRVAPPPPVITTTGLVNAATGVVGPIAPGELVVLYGKNLGPEVIAMPELDSNGRVATELRGARVFFDGFPAPVIYTLSGQMSVIVPYGVANRANVRVEAEYLGVRSTPITMGVAQTSPGIFTTNSSGTGQGSILNQDSTVNGVDNPAERGSIIAIYATGEGQVDPQALDGAINSSVFPKPLQPVSVSIGGASADVLYAGAAPGMVAGVLQLNVAIPAGIAPGTAEVRVRIGSAMSPPGVTLAVK